MERVQEDKEKERENGACMKEEGGIVSDKVLWPLRLDSVAEQQFCRRLHVP